MRDILMPKRKVYWEINTNFGPLHDAKNTLHHGRYGIEVQLDALRDVISRGVDSCVTEILDGCNQSMCPESVAQQNASSSTEQSVADMGRGASRSKSKSTTEEKCGTKQSCF